MFVSTHAFYPVMSGVYLTKLLFVCGRAVQFRIKSVEGEYFRAETSACMTDKGVVCSTRVDRDI